MPEACLSKVLQRLVPISGVTIPLMYLCNAKVLNYGLGNHLGFSYFENMIIDHLFKTSGLQFDNWLFRPEKLSWEKGPRVLNCSRLQISSLRGQFNKEQLAGVKFEKGFSSPIL